MEFHNYWAIGVVEIGMAGLYAPLATPSQSPRLLGNHDISCSRRTREESGSR